MHSATTKSDATFDDYRWLLGPDAAARLSELQSKADSSTIPLNSLVKRLRADLPPARVHLLIEQFELRRRAGEKFHRADEMFFTRLGLEQSSDQWVADYKASRFPCGETVADLCCGIGGDALSLARSGSVLGVDRDPVAALLADANLRSGGGSGAGQWRSEVIVADVASIDLSAAAAWHIDPDRRPAGRRTTRVELHEPGPEVLRRLLADCPNAAIKLAPAAMFEEPWWQEAELEWISRGRQCRQLVTWFGGLAEHPGHRRATVLRSTSLSGADNAASPIVATFVGKPNVDGPIASKICRYVFEPDAAVLAAKLEGALVANQNLSAVAGGVAYFTADHHAKHGALACFEVLEVMPYKVKPLRQWLAARSIGRLEVKKRGVPLEPKQVRKDLQTDGCDEATILLARIGGRITSIIARRCIG